MRKFLLPLFASLFFFTNAVAQFSLPLSQAMEEDRNTYHIIVILAEKVDLEGMEAEFDKHQIHPDERVQKVYYALQQKASSSQQQLINYMNAPQRSAGRFEVKQQYWLVNMMEVLVDEAALQQLATSGVVSYIKLVGEDRVYMDEPIVSKRQEAASVPGGREPGLEAIGAPALWKMGYSGLGQRALIFDSGIMQEHPAVGDQFLYFNTPGKEGWNGMDSPIPKDRPGNHGTHVTGTTLGLDRSTEDTIGVAFNARFMSTDPILDKPPYRNMSDYVEHYQFYFNPDGDTSTFDDVPDVINNSWGLFSLDTALCTNYAADMAGALSTAGIAVIFSAGNDGPDSLTIGRPAFINVNLVTPFAVGAVNGYDTSYPITGFSSRGPSICPGDSGLKIKPEAVAPGLDVRSSVGTNGYVKYSGTSMAAPHVSGAVLLLKEAFPYLPGKDLLEALYFTASDLGPAGEDNTYGRGLIDLPAAFNYLANTHTPVPPKERIYDLVVTEVQLDEEGFACTDSVAATATVVNKGDSAAHDVKTKIYKGSAVIDSFTLSQPVEPGATISIPVTFDGIEGNRRQEYGVGVEWQDQVEEYDPVDNRRYVRFYSRDIDQNATTAQLFTMDSVFLGRGIFVRENPDKAITWEKTALSYDSTEQVLLLNFRDYTPREGQQDMLYTPLFKSVDGSFYLSFDYAFATKSTFFKDSLYVEYSTDCGETFDKVILRKGAEDLLTYPAAYEDPEPGEWKTFDTTFQPGFGEEVLIRFRGVNDLGGRLFIDNLFLQPFDAATGLHSSKHENLSIAPNPAYDHIKISVSPAYDIRSFAISSMDGRLMKQGNVENPDARVAIGNLPAGVYLVRVNTDNGTMVQKFVKGK